MISIKFTEASKFQNSLLSKDFSTPINKHTYFIGRGEELQQKQSQANGIIDLNKFDNTLSRVHASICFSPAWFIKQNERVPVYLKEVSFEGVKLTAELVEKIWNYIRPKKRCILRDLKSKVGIFSRIEQQFVETEMIIQFVHQSYLKVQYCEKYDDFNEFQERIKFYSKNQTQKRVIYGDLLKIKQNYLAQNNLKEKKELLQIWHLSVKENKCLLLMQQGLILRIGRSSHCEIQVKDSAISRYQAFLKCENRKWKIVDGNQIERSKNGTWKKEKFIEIPISTNQDNLTKIYLKIGTIKCEIEVVQKYTWLNIQKIAKGDVSSSFIELGMTQNETFQSNFTQLD